MLVTYATDLLLRAIKCCSVVFGVTLNLLVINISLSFPAINKHRRLLAAKCHNLRDVTDVVRRRRIDSTWPVAALTAVKPDWLRIAISAYTASAFNAFIGGRFPSECCYAIWCVKSRMVWLPCCENILKICLFVSTQLANVTHRHTHTHTHLDIDTA